MIKIILAVNLTDLPRPAIKHIRPQMPDTGHGVVSVDDDGNPMAEWIKSKGFGFELQNDSFVWVAIWTA